MANPVVNGVTDSSEYGGEDFVRDEIPEMLQDDSLIIYFRHRFADRKKYMASINEEHGEQRLQRELDRIETSRAEYERRNPGPIKALEDCRAKWKRHAKQQCAENMQSVGERVAHMEKLHKHRHPDETDLKPFNRQRREHLEKCILEKVGKWELSSNLGLQDSTADKKADQKRRFSVFSMRKGEKASQLSKGSDIQGPAIVRNEKDSTNDDYGMRVLEIIMTKSKSPTSYTITDKINSYSLEDILREGSPLKKSGDVDKIRYFHIPSNNMRWVEEAISRYYDEDPGEFDYRKHPDYREKASNILNRKYWTSLQHGNVHDPIHARHMRSHCSLITPENNGGSRNFVVFMPYLHWETHSRQQTMAQIISEETRNHKTKNSTSSALQAARKAFYKTVDEIKMKHARHLADVEIPGGAKNSARNAKDGIKTKRTELAEYILEIARVYNAMDIDADVRILRDKLYQKSPLHPRRTLDQSYYWKLSDTTVRDQDQVVYRETESGTNVLRTSRVIMVDQLWLYILDDNTIISFFPKRWGRNKPDWSGVHKSIRTRLSDKNLRPDEIQSVYDLAIIIMDQCSTVFFDRTKPVDERPELLDIFSNALSHVSSMKCTAFETFWQNLDKLSANYQEPEFESTARKHLNINPEGQLLRDAHDIIDELRMMGQVFDEQLQISETFSKHLEDLTSKGSEKESASDGTLQVLVDIRKLLEEKDSGATNSKGPGNESMKNGRNSESNQVASTTSRIIPDKTLHHARDLIHEIAQRRSELQKLEDRTSYVSGQVKDLLDLKQQQASIIEAKYALKRADESVNQGRSIMLFTIITIIFLPLSFMISVFGMNASDLETSAGGSSMSLREEFKIICAFIPVLDSKLTHQVPISLAVVIVSLSLAFMPWVRGGIFWISTVTWAMISEYTGLRYIWLKAISHHDKESGKLKYHEVDAVFASQRRTVNKITSRLERRKVKDQMEEARRLIEEDGNRPQSSSTSGQKNTKFQIESGSLRAGGSGKYGLKVYSEDV